MDRDLNLILIEEYCYKCKWNSCCFDDDKSDLIEEDFIRCFDKEED
ncbi:MAG: hypothetical protein ACRCX8_08760 [Sarcina sp.]